MGHIPPDSYVGPGGAAAAGGGAGAPVTTPAGPRQLEAVRRGAVRARTPGQQVVPGCWEHLEMAVDEGPDRLSSLSLDAGGTFQATLSEQQHDADGSCETRVLANASGTWHRCRGGVELEFSEEPDLDLPDFQVAYMLRRGCLVADGTELPDGLAQEYSRCPDSTSATAPLAAERLSLIDRMLADAAGTRGEGDSALVQPARSPEFTATAPAVRRQCRDADSDSDDCVEGTAAVGILADGSSDSDGEIDAGGISPRFQEQVAHCPLQAAVAEDKVVAGEKKDDEEEEYLDDFDGESDDGESNDGAAHGAASL